jgi:hypothetical protein
MRFNIKPSLTTPPVESRLNVALRVDEMGHLRLDAQREDGQTGTIFTIYQKGKFHLSENNCKKLGLVKYED